MNENIYQIQFPNTNHPPISLEQNQNLAEHLTIENSPILFGCRTGICGTCLVTIEGDIPPPSAEEKEVLEILAPENPHARLACQIQVTNYIKIIN
ncbi:2Fe-2S iron-sulfur cluster-binding protein [Rivularia sp. UHCC 0363]|uniref:2Fe-2S iron-sulfur cluster-binding protein n=1 Tax=Rivularia sp. UHCC 0363 TaxID=3110244 RepID=UPI002B21380A|nr:2Fe-2S iron-sulfur cluster-binding protein [Rivularia sp. UHCC 0363]MEA5594343.1 2Fe-2S iron-sulfur cluster-binding protein [Rivularia sp. UHCC 0363]